MDVLSRLDEARARWDVLSHPFYVRWSRGELSSDELEFYAGEYRHAVVALAGAARAAAAGAPAEHADSLARHADEEAAHLALWDRFAARAGTNGPREARPETARCAAAWLSGSDLLERLAVLYAVEAGQPAISQTKLDGLVDHYGYEHGTAATEYFELHAELDREHAAHSRSLIERMADASDGQRLEAAAESAVRANWALLDGVERAFGR